MPSFYRFVLGNRTILPYHGSSCLLIFGKVPGRIQTKTRLLESTPLSEQEISLLSTAFLFDTLSTAMLASSSKLVFASTPKISAMELEAEFNLLPSYLEKIAFHKLEIIEQRGESFGTRLQNSLQKWADRNDAGIVIIGTDSPTVPACTIAEALRLVESGNFVLGPSSGGGVYLIGLPAALINSSFSFEQGFRSEDKTDFEELSEHAERHGLKPCLLHPHFDIDVAQDLIYLHSILPALPPSNCDSDNSHVFSFPQATAAVWSGFNISIEKDTANNRSWLLNRSAQ